MGRAEKFLQIYNDFDREVKRILSVSVHMPHNKALNIIAKRNKLVQKNLDILKSYSRLRNSIVHETITGAERAIAEPLPEVVENYENILNRLKNPLTAYDICTYRQKLLVATSNNLAIDIMNAMKEMLITRVPIIKDDRVVGVFNGNTLIYYMINKKNPIITEETTIKDFMEYATLDTYRKENFDFVATDTTVFEIEELFRRENENNHKLIALFITSDGSQKGKLLGMVTEWDLYNKTK
ncbi:CBS domain-containing protein [Dethiothermospora halolimnae]|uniref:CBS domain-containing protein n=1 Tax=Dethiothermospora halolimnae TaxID=3114390 RepID=UPI003CCC267A